MKIGANYLSNNKCEFTVWAPLRKEVNLQIITPEEKTIPMQQLEQGYWQITVDNVPPGTRYYYQLDEIGSRPDPASHHQPEGVHKASEVVDPSSYTWNEKNWQNLPLEDMIIYELHVGTFTPEGTFEAIIDKLNYLKELGINAIEIMPIAQFPGSRNWGYDGAYTYAVQHSYGGPEKLKKLIDVCHQQNIAVILDVVYNHFGPEGNYTSNFAPYFTDRYHTPWGSAINLDDAHSDGVRNYFIENALYWFENYHFDGLRLDAVHAIYDFGAKHFLAELTEKVAALSQEKGRKFYLIAESDLNDVRVINSPEKGGHGIDTQWSDDFHHILHTTLTGETGGYYQDFTQFNQLIKVFREAFVYDWKYSPCRQRTHGSYAGDLPTQKFVVFSQNHDQVGNRMLGERLTALVSFEALKLAAAAVILSPYIPMLFMGEEYGEEAPFLYFISHGDPNLVEAVRQGRKREFAEFHKAGEPPDAQSEETFNKSKLNWQLHKEGKHKVLFELYQQLIALRQKNPAFKQFDRKGIKISGLEAEKLLFIHRWYGDNQTYCLMNFSRQPVTWKADIPNGTWNKQIDSSETQWMGPETKLPDSLDGSKELTIQPLSFAVYTT
ncbi:MAG: malto-oligosyltrehalose trehalohydrolase [Oscillatoria sp. PMC 1051.18]|nr:malto-oligosyltrehalose trehalohydrolase [Oscillatoria sp. PMC 1050.18]MEC5030179.1 malto-oligosyltrehalose trehalohydrolase [Oscillatoria sp. PMC 1051.18]